MSNKLSENLCYRVKMLKKCVLQKFSWIWIKFFNGALTDIQISRIVLPFWTKFTNCRSSIFSALSFLFFCLFQSFSVFFLFSFPLLFFYILLVFFSSSLYFCLFVFLKPLNFFVYFSLNQIFFFFTCCFINFLCLPCLFMFLFCLYLVCTFVNVC
jgi:hypothetical protein